MGKFKLRAIGFLTITALLLTPLIIFKIQDQHNLDKKIPWQNSSLDKELMKKYPIINDIYTEFFTNITFQDEDTRYVIRNKDNYSADQQVKITELQELFKQEVNLLLEQEVIDYHLLELSSPDLYQVNFGTIYDKSLDDHGVYILDQLYRFNSDNDNYANFAMNAKSKKITSLSLTNHSLAKLKKADLKKMGWQMIEYLGLAKIDDWNYTDYGYESYQAKLQIVCEVLEFSGDYTLDIGVSMLGSSRKMIVN